MPKYGYWLIEKTTIYHEVEAKDKDEADWKVEEYLADGDIDWGVGDMEVDYEFDGEEV